MKKYFVLSFLCLVFVMACKSKKSQGSSAASTSTAASTASTTQTVIGSTMGTVSHKYRSTGCSTVIIVKQDEEELTLIPKDKMSKEFDVDGTMIMFNYLTLKMPQPQGCSIGIPADITDISKK